MQDQITLGHGSEGFILFVTPAIAKYADRQNSYVGIRYNLHNIQKEFKRMQDRAEYPGTLTEHVDPNAINDLDGGVYAWKEGSFLKVSWHKGGITNLNKFLEGWGRKVTAEFQQHRANVLALQTLWNTPELLEVMQDYISANNTRFSSMFCLQPSDDLTYFVDRYLDHDGVLKKFLDLGIDPAIFTNGEKPLYVYTYMSAINVSDRSAYESTLDDSRNEVELHGIYSREVFRGLMMASLEEDSQRPNDYSYAIDEKILPEELMAHNPAIGKCAVNPLYFVVPELKDKLQEATKGFQTLGHIRTLARDFRFPEAFFVGDEMAEARNAVASYANRYGLERVLEIAEDESIKIDVPDKKIEHFFVRLKALQDSGKDPKRYISKLDPVKTDDARFLGWALVARLDFSEAPGVYDLTSSAAISGR